VGRALTVGGALVTNIGEFAAAPCLHLEKRTRGSV